MKHELLTLLTRRTQQARENANRDLRELQRIVEVIKRGAKAAKCSVHLSPEVTNTLAKRLKRTDLLTYVLAVEESTRARTQTSAILREGQQQIRLEIKTRQNEREKVEHEIQDLKSEADTEKLKCEKEAAWAQPLGGIGIGIVLGGFCWLTGGCHEWAHAQTKAWPLWWDRSAALWWFLTPTLIGVLLSLLWLTVQVLSARETKRKLSSKLDPLEEHLSLINQREQKARAALKWLQEQIKDKIES